MRRFFGLLLVVFCWSVTTAESSQEKSDLMVAGGKLSQIADQLEQTAKDTIKQANLERQSIIKLRQQFKDQNLSNYSKEDQDFKLKSKVASAQALQQAAPLIRKQSELVRQQALHKLTMGMQQRYAGWIVNTGPVVIGEDSVKSPGSTMAHNTRIMSTSPSMQDERPTAPLARNKDMSLELTSSMSQDLPKEIDTSSFVVSRERQYFAHIEVENEGANSGVLINKIQSWRLILTETNGLPVRNAVVRFNGHMPGHVHGLPTQPIITKEVAPGVYRIAGVKFQMAGWWVIELELDIPMEDSEPVKSDALRFNLSL